METREFKQKLDAGTLTRRELQAALARGAP